MNIQRPPSIRTEQEDAGFVANYLLYLLAVASDRLSGEFHAQVREQGVRVPEWRVLACLLDHDGQMVTQLARLALMEQSHLTKIINAMVLKGLLSRGSDRRDRRRVRVYLTETGRRLASSLVAEAKTHEASIVELITPAKAHALKQVLSQIIELHEASAEMPLPEETR